MLEGLYNSTFQPPLLYEITARPAPRPSAIQIHATLSAALAPLAADEIVGLDGVRARAFLL